MFAIVTLYLRREMVFNTRISTVLIIFLGLCSNNYA